MGRFISYVFSPPVYQSASSTRAGGPVNRLLFRDQAVLVSLVLDPHDLRVVGVLVNDC